MRDNTPPLHGHAVRTISYVHLKRHIRNKISAETDFLFIRKAFYGLNYPGQKKHTVSQGNATHRYHKNSALLKC